jgi:flagellar basal-body rod protein FlgF
MDRLIYTAMSGATAALQQQGVLANNLANSSTNGFRAEMSTFRAVPVQGGGASTRVLALEATAGYSNAGGTVQTTGRALDVAAKGQAWFTVQGLDGTEAQTRNGSFDVSPEGTLMTTSGLTVLGDGGPITVPPGADLSIGVDGVISAKVGNQASTGIGRLKMVTPTAEQPLQRGADGLFRTADGSSLPADPQARLQSGALETSNVNPVSAMVEMMQAARQFESQMKLLQSAEANDKSAAQLLQVNG